MDDQTVDPTPRIFTLISITFSKDEFETCSHRLKCGTCADQDRVFYRCVEQMFYTFFLITY